MPVRSADATDARPPGRARSAMQKHPITQPHTFRKAQTRGWQPETRAVEALHCRFAGASGTVGPPLLKAVAAARSEWQKGRRRGVAQSSAVIGPFLEKGQGQNCTICAWGSWTNGVALPCRTHWALVIVRHLSLGEAFGGQMIALLAGCCQFWRRPLRRWPLFQTNPLPAPHFLQAQTPPGTANGLFWFRGLVGTEMFAFLSALWHGS